MARSMKALQYPALLALAINLIGYSNSEATPSGESVAAVLVSGWEPGLSGTITARGQNIAWKTSLISSAPYVTQYTSEIRGGAFTGSYTVKANDACKYNVSLKYEISGQKSERGEQNFDVDFSSLKDAKSEGDTERFLISFGDSCAVNNKISGCEPSLHPSKLALSFEKLQTAVSEMKAICKPN